MTDYPALKRIAWEGKACQTMLMKLAYLAGNAVCTTYAGTALFREVACRGIPVFGECRADVSLKQQKTCRPTSPYVDTVTVVLCSNSSAKILPERPD